RALCAHRAALAGEALELGVHLALALSPAGPAEPHRADRLLRRAAAGTGNAAHGHGEIRAAQVERAARHLGDYGLTHGPVGGERRRVHTQQRFLGAVGVADDAVAEADRAAGDVGDGLG